MSRHSKWLAFWEDKYFKLTTEIESQEDKSNFPHQKSLTWLCYFTQLRITGNNKNINNNHNDHNSNNNNNKQNMSAK